VIETADRAAEQDYTTSQIVVAIQHAKLVANTLVNEFHMPVAEADRDTRLGLVLLDIRNVGRITARDWAIESTFRDVFSLAELERLRRLRQRSSDLDELLARLRIWFSSHYDGWIPLFGKNRVVDAIVGSPYPRSITYVLSEPTLRDGGQLLDLEVAYGGRPGVGVTEGIPPRVSADPEAGHAVRVGLLDTRLYPHPSLAGHYFAPADVLHRPANDQVVEPIAGHATLIADLIRRQAPGAELVVQRALSDDNGTARVWETAKKMMSFADAGIDVLNLSFGCYTRDGEPPLVLRRAIELLSPRMVIVAAAGNHGIQNPATLHVTPKSPVWPAALPDVVAVGAHRPEAPFGPADFTPKEAPWIQFTATGVHVDGVYIDARVNVPGSECPVESKGRVRWSGTSFAAATVSGIIAANTKPGEKTARQALAELSDDPNSVVKKLR